MTRRHPTTRPVAPPTTPPTPEAGPGLSRRLAAEAFGTFVLVLGGCGAAVLAGDVVGTAGVAAAFGLSVLTAAYAVGHVSGGHFNPAVSLGAAVAGRLSWRLVPAYVATQVLAAIAAAAVLLALASGRAGFDVAEGFATNGWGDASPAGYTLVAAAIAEVVLTALFVWTILGVTDTRAPQGFGPLAIGLSLTLVHLVSIPVDNTSVNPARSIGPALMAGGTAIEQLWLFVLAPLVGALVAGATYVPIFGGQDGAQVEELEDVEPADAAGRG